MSVVYFLVLVGVLVAIHEFGHFVAAKLLDFKVTRFSVGFGRPLFRVKGGETEYQLALFPLGGYVRIVGEDPSEPIAPEDRRRSFSAKPLWQRLVVVFAGPAANLIFPVFIYFISFAGDTELPSTVIGDVLSDTPAARAGLEPGDRVLSIDGESVRYWEELEEHIQGNIGEELRFRIRRGTREFERDVTPIPKGLRHRDGTEAHRGLLGIVSNPSLPQVGVIDPASPAGRAGLVTGDRIVSVDGEQIRGWTDLKRALSGNARRMNIVYFRGTKVGASGIKFFSPRHGDLVSNTTFDGDGRRSVVHGIDSAEMFIAHVDPGSPADVAGLHPGDLITSLDGEALTHWFELDQRLQAQPDRSFPIAWRRADDDGRVDSHSATVKQIMRSTTDEYGHRAEILVFGATSEFDRGRGEMIAIDGRLRYAMSKALERTFESIGVMAAGFLSVLRGRSPSEEIGGPIMMFRVASVSGHKGWSAFLLMLALVSISVGLINLLPIPVLDGGHLLVFALEAILRKKLSPRARDRIMVVGLGMVGIITIIALRNDIVRYIV